MVIKVILARMKNILGILPMLLFLFLIIMVLGQLGVPVFEYVWNHFSSYIMYIMVSIVVIFGIVMLIRAVLGFIRK